MLKIRTWVRGRGRIPPHHRRQYDALLPTFKVSGRNHVISFPCFWAQAVGVKLGRGKMIQVDEMLDSKHWKLNAQR